MYEYKGKHLIIIGAGLLQVPVIKVANTLGIKTIVTDYNENAPGMKIADYPVVISTRDVDGTVRIMKEMSQKIKIDGVITVGTDASMTVAAVANALGLPGIKFENAEAASNKIKMRERLRVHNVPIPDFYKVWSFQDLTNAAKKLGYPFVIKPADNMGARGVMKIENEVMLEAGFLNAKRGSPSGELIAEQYMDGPELSIDALIYNDQIYITGVADRLIEREPYFIEVGHVLPSALPEDILNQGIEVFKQGIRALGINIGAAKGDIKITKEGAKVGEIAARLSGGFMSAYTFPYATGINLMHNAIDIALGYPPHNLVPTRNAVAIEKALIPEPGIVEDIVGIEEAYTINGFKELFLHVKIGDEVNEPKSNVEKAGNFIVVRDTREEAWETVKKVEQVLKIKTTKKEDKLSWDEIRHRAREKFNRTCYACAICNGVECKGKIPGVGGIGNGMAFVRNCEDLQKVFIITETITEVKEIDTTVDFFGYKLELPVLAAPVAGCDINMGGKISEFEYDIELLKGCLEGGIIGFVGDGAPPELYKTGIQAIEKCNGFGGLIMKPRSDEKEIFKRIELATEKGIKFLGMDIDGAAFLTMEISNQQVEPKSIEKLRKIIEKSNVPFILKGIMSVSDAKKATETGASAIVVSNHGGRITESHPSSISVLPEIVEAVKGKIKIIFDGGIRTGEDVFKALAIGADFVMIGRPFAVGVMGAGKEGIKVYLNKIKKEFKKIMLLTGCYSITDINKNKVRFKFF